MPTGAVSSSGTKPSGSMRVSLMALSVQREVVQAAALRPCTASNTASCGSETSAPASPPFTAWSFTRSSRKTRRPLAKPFGVF